MNDCLRDLGVLDKVCSHKLPGSLSERYVRSREYCIV
jgi:hypothetical protein